MQIYTIKIIVISTGYSNKINTAGVTYYRNILKELRENDIEPIVTIYHGDLPQNIQDKGGWPNSDIIHWYIDYAKVCFQLFGDMVKYWITFNEPKEFCTLGYSSAEAQFLCSHNLLISHARVYHLYNDSYRESQRGL